MAQLKVIGTMMYVVRGESIAFYDIEIGPHAVNLDRAAKNCINLRDGKIRLVQRGSRAVFTRTSTAPNGYVLNVASSFNVYLIEDGIVIWNCNKDFQSDTANIPSTWAANHFGHIIGPSIPAGIDFDFQSGSIPGAPLFDYIIHVGNNDPNLVVSASPYQSDDYFWRDEGT